VTNQRDMTPAEMVSYLADREERLLRGEPVVDLMKFEPFIEIDENGAQWVVYRRVEFVTS
jgi:hypothetical protein